MTNGGICEISWEIRGDGAERWQVVLAVGFGDDGMKRGEVLVRLLEGQLVGVTFSDGNVSSKHGDTLGYPSHAKPLREGRQSRVR